MLATLFISIEWCFVANYEVKPESDFLRVSASRLYILVPIYPIPNSNRSYPMIFVAKLAGMEFWVDYKLKSHEAEEE